ncbi:hypothetical protein T05_7437 [Trichinella murrelli]|uniref:Uncharacterized protein n=1 Tax=Trichinella murrelli TaxID=144512 RepID=A0A0V0U8M0_9BILA|nr:hypothetical protein T05_7437 [Trichinella murrelli]
MSKKLFFDYGTMTEEHLNGFAIMCTFILILELILGWQYVVRLITISQGKTFYLAASSTSKFYKSSTDGGYEGGDSRDGWSVTEFGPEMEVPGGEGGEEVQDREALERKCICGDHRKIVSVHQVDIFVELAREWEACQKIIRRPVLHKQAQKEKITNDMKIDLEFRHE